MKSNTWMTIQEIEMHDARDVAAGLVDKLSLAMQEVAERKNITRAEGRHLADLRDLFNRLFESDKAPHCRNGRG